MMASTLRLTSILTCCVMLCASLLVQSTLACMKATGKARRDVADMPGTATLDPAYLGKWKLDHSKKGEGVKEFGKKLGLSDQLISIYDGLDFNFSVERVGEVSDNTYKVRSESSLKPSSTSVVKLGKTVKGVDSLGFNIESTFVIDIEGTPTIFYRYPEFGYTRTIKFTLDDNCLTTVNTIDGVSMTRHFKRV